MKNKLSHLILMLCDALLIFIAISIAYFLRIYLEDWLNLPMTQEYLEYVLSTPVYLIVLIVFFHEKIYSQRYDFWEETRLVLRGLFVSFLIILTILALTKNIEQYSRSVILFSFISMAILIPIGKNIIKKILFRFGLWKREAEVYGYDSSLKNEIFNNPYLGYIHSSSANAQTIFIDTDNISKDKLQERLDESLKEKKEVVFIPLLQAYNFANARVIDLSNARKNLIVLENALLKKRNVIIKKMSDIIFAIMVIPFLIMVFLIIIFLMKRENPKGKIFFKQKRIGQDGKEFTCYKFRSMYENGNAILKVYLKEHPEEIDFYDRYHKYKNDPRITKVGQILRKTSLDELPQILNVLKGEMSLIGPRPYMLNEQKKIGNKVDMILAVKPGITGLWQVSGRNEVDFNSRVDIDVWYTRNWNLWLDLVILVKTIKVVLFRDGAH